MSRNMRPSEIITTTYEYIQDVFFNFYIFFFFQKSIKLYSLNTRYLFFINALDPFKVIKSVAWLLPCNFFNRKVACSFISIVLSYLKCMIFILCSCYQPNTKFKVKSLCLNCSITFRLHVFYPSLVL